MWRNGPPHDGSVVDARYGSFAIGSSQRQVQPCPKRPESGSSEYCLPQGFPEQLGNWLLVQH